MPERLCEAYGGLPERDGPRTGMVRVPGGTFTMGDDDERPEERHAHRVTVSVPFWIDRHEVTNAQFARFVAATGHRTVAERGLGPETRPDLPPDLRVPGSMVFAAPAGTRDLGGVARWWRYVPGADWRHPLGPGSSVEGRGNLPVVHVAYEDAQAYARWLGRDLPTEAEWELAARGGLEGATYAWGEDYYDPAEGWRANSWQGPFPALDEGEDGFHGLAPVGCFAPNGYGLLDMTGNVWEYAHDWYVPGHPAGLQEDPAGPGMALAARFAGPDGPAAVIKGGSWLCAPDFCARYRPSARQPQVLRLGTNHVGFRTVLREGVP
jgi:formylglycine-generating enzyme required for sulfatase activity